MTFKKKIFGAIFAKIKAYTAILRRFSPNFAKISTDFARIFTKSKVLGVRLHPSLLRQLFCGTRTIYVHQFGPSSFWVVQTCWTSTLTVLAIQGVFVLPNQIETYLVKTWSTRSAQRSGVLCNNAVFLTARLALWLVDMRSQVEWTQFWNVQQVTVSAAHKLC